VANTATGGEGGDSDGANGGNGADGIALTSSGLLAEGPAEAKGGSGTTAASATTDGGIITDLVATAAAPINGTTYAGATAQYGTATEGAYFAADNS
jgi:hypothetical protein